MEDFGKGHKIFVKKKKVQGGEQSGLQNYEFKTLSQDGLEIYWAQCDNIGVQYFKDHGKEDIIHGTQKAELFAERVVKGLILVADAHL